jgi:hypothetical protein
MMLPATFVEAEALQTARGLVRFMLERNDVLSIQGMELLPVGPLHPEAGRIFLRQCVKHDLTISDTMWLELMHGAEAGDNDVIAALDEISDGYLHRGDVIPAFVRTYIAKRRHGHIRPRGGKSAGTNYLRDLCIVVVVLKLVDYFGPSLKFTRAPYERASRPRSGPRAPSACSIVHCALSEARVFGGDEAAVNKIYGRFKSKGWLRREGSAWIVRSAIEFGHLSPSVRKLPAPQ